MDDCFENDAFEMTIPVAWGDMDAFEHVNNTVYFKWCESARIGFFGKIGLLQSRQQTGVGPILAAIQCRFKAPLFYPDSVRVGLRVTRLGDTDFELHYTIFSERTQKVVAEAQDRCVIYDYSQGQKTQFPAAVYAALLSLQPHLRSPAEQNPL